MIYPYTCLIFFNNFYTQSKTLTENTDKTKQKAFVFCAAI